MTAFTTAFDRQLGVQVDLATLKTLAIFCGAGLTLSLLLAAQGLDLSGALF